MVVMLYFPCYFRSPHIFRENMLGFPVTAALASPTPISISILTTSKPLPILPLITKAKQPSSSLNFQRSPRNPRKIVVRAENRNGPSKDPKQETEKKGDEGLKDSTAGDGGEDVKRNGRPTFNLRWTDLVLDPDPDNVVAVGLTGLLAWACVQVLWQLFFISLAILVAALKYSFIAALLIFILIALL